PGTYYINNCKRRGKGERNRIGSGFPRIKKFALLRRAKSIIQYSSIRRKENLLLYRKRLESSSRTGRVCSGGKAVFRMRFFRPAGGLLFSGISCCVRSFAWRRSSR